MLRGLPSVVLFVAAAALAATSLLLSLPTASTGPPPATALAQAQVPERQGLTLVHLSAQRKHFVWTGAKAEAWCLLIHADASLSLCWGVPVTNTAQVTDDQLTSVSPC
jgi:hypothetical protein